MTLLDTHIGFVEALRSAGLPVSLAEGLDALAALDAVTWHDRETVRGAYAATLVKRQAQRPTFDALFDLYWPALVGGGVAGAEVPAEEGPVRDNAEALRDFRDRLAEAMASGDEQTLQRLATEAVGRFGAMPGRGPGLSSWSSYTALQRVDPKQLVGRIVAGLLGIAIAAAVASLSKYVLAWRGRHIFNPAAMGATVLTLLSLAWPDLGASSWWVGTPALAAPVILLGLAVLVRTEKLRVVAVFLVIAVGVAVFRTASQYQAAGLEVEALDLLWPVLWSSPFLFLGAFMLSEPLTLPPRRWQQLTVATVVGVLAGWPIPIGDITLGQERALLVGNLVAFAFALRTAVRLTLVSRAAPTATVQELTFRVHDRLAFLPGQYLELEVPHRHPDARGTRREFSIASAPEDLPLLKVAFKEGGSAKPLSSYKKALAEVQPGDALAITGVWGDFLLPKRDAAPILMVAAGIGVTPFVSQLRHARGGGGGQEHHYDRRPGRGRRPPRAEGLGGTGRGAVRLLPVRPDHGRRGPDQGQAPAHRRRHRCRHGRQPVPLRHLPAHPRGRAPRRRDRRAEGLSARPLPRC